MSVWTELKNTFAYLWNIATSWARLCQLSALLYPLLVIAASLAGLGFFWTSVVALIPFIILVISVAALRDLLAVPAIGTALEAVDGIGKILQQNLGLAGRYRNAVNWFRALVGLDCAIGLLFSVVHLSVDPKFVPALLLNAVALIWLAGTEKFPGLQSFLKLSLFGLLAYYLALGSDIARTAPLNAVDPSAGTYYAAPVEYREGAKQVLDWVRTLALGKPDPSIASTTAVPATSPIVASASAISSPPLSTADYETISLAGQPLVKVVYTLRACESTKWIRLNPDERPQARSVELKVDPDKGFVFTPLGASQVDVASGARDMRFWEYMGGGHWFRITVPESATITVTVAR